MLAEESYIDKSRVLPPTQDYDFLRTEGFKYIEALGSRLWTDYNSHDPGVTILEALCYAITELGYRTDFDIKDLLADPRGNISDKQAFFSARNILSAAPLTTEDYRKLLVDIRGVKNAWLYPRSQEVPLYAHCGKDMLTYGKTEHLIGLRGLFKVVLDLEESDELGDLNNGNLTVGFPVEELLGLRFQLLFPRWDTVDHQFIQSADPESMAGVNVTQVNDRWHVSFEVSDASSTRPVAFEAFILARQDVSDVEAQAGMQLADPGQLKPI
ncbi:MAG TPA: hypothetical protein VD772_10570, partial [Anseongella sp.]|nr:hypothetical protein [Anseongella sp.]